MKTMWKFPFRIQKAIQIEMPWGASIKLVEVQDGEPTLWAEVHPANPKVTRRFWLVGTGDEIPEEADQHVASFQMPPDVWHLYEETP